MICNSGINKLILFPNSQRSTEMDVVKTSTFKTKTGIFVKKIVYAGIKSGTVQTVPTVPCAAPLVLELLVSQLNPSSRRRISIPLIVTSVDQDLQMKLLSWYKFFTSA